MSGLEFEKNMQQKMDELNIRPSDAVWTAVEKQIRRDKRRRVLIWWWPFLLLSLATGGYFVLHNSAGKKASMAHMQGNDQRKQDKSAITTNRTNQNAHPSGKNDQGKQDEQAIVTADKTKQQEHQPQATEAGKQDEQALATTDKAKQNDHQPTNDIARQDEHALPVTSEIKQQHAGMPKEHDDNAWAGPAKQHAGKPQEKDRADRLHDAIPVISPGKAPVTSLSPGNNRISIHQQSTNRPDASAVTTETAAAAAPVTKQVPVNEPVITDTNNNKQPVVASAKPDTSQVGTVKEILDSLTAVTVQPSAAPDIAKKKNKRKLHLQWGIVAAAGTGQTSNEKGLNLQSSAVADVTSNYYAQASPAAIGPGIYSRPSKVAAGLSYTVGGFMRTSLSKRFSLTAGLQYARYNTYITVGDKTNAPLYNSLTSSSAASTRVNSYYRGNNTDPQKYNNRYHFIELPVALSWQLNRSARWPIYWNAGPSVSYLFNTTALQYDSKNGAYYNDNSLFNRWQLSLSMGFDVGLFNQSRLPLRVGPSFNYGVTNLLHGVSDNQHVLSLGLQIKVLLKK